jgi:two-component sensor histidine kinase
MARRRSTPTEDQLTLYDEASLLSRLSEQQSRLVSDVLDQAARSGDIAQENVRLARDLAGSLDRLREVHHRVRNHLQTVTGLLSAQEVTEQSAGARRALQKSVGRLTSIAAIHDLLARDPTSGDLRLPDFTHQLARHLVNHAGAEQRLRVHVDVCALTLPPKQATALVLILTELLSNAVEHAFPKQSKGEIFVRVTREDSGAVLEVRDTGRGLPPDFDLQQSDRLGMRLITRLGERDLGGSVTAHSGQGACFRVTFPVGVAEGNT